jgi:hypothetical protein
MHEGKRDFIDALAPQLYVALVSRPNPNQYPSDVGESGAKHAAAQAFFLAEEFWKYKVGRPVSPARQLRNAILAEEETFEHVPTRPTQLDPTPPPFDKDKAFDDEFRDHLSRVASKETARLYLAAIKDAALLFNASKRDLSELPAWKTTYQIVVAFSSMLRAPAAANDPALARGLEKRVITDIHHAMKVMRLCE